MFNYLFGIIKILNDRINNYIFPTNNVKLIGYDNVKYRKNNNINRLFKRIGTLEQYNSFFSDPTYIIDNIYIGSAFNATSYNKLKELNINTIVNVTNELSNYYPDDFHYINCKIYDNNKDSISVYLDNLYEYICNNGDKNILIHCYMGASRSVSMVIYYLMKKYSKTYNEALFFLKEKRYVVNPTVKLKNDVIQSFL